MGKKHRVLIITTPRYPPFLDISLFGDPNISLEQAVQYYDIIKYYSKKD